MDNNHKTRVEFTPPGEAPEHEGDEFDLVCTFRTKTDGQVCMTKWGDHPMPGYEDRESMKKENKPGYGEMAQGIASQEVPNAGAGGGGY